MPEDGPSREISRILKGKYDDCWPTWTAISDEYRDMWFDSFQVKNSVNFFIFPFYYLIFCYITYFHLVEYI